MYIQIKNFNEKAAKRYPLFVGDSTDKGKFVCEIWSFAKATFDEDVKIYDKEYDVAGEIDSGTRGISSGVCYIETSGKNTAKGIIEKFGMGSIVRAVKLRDNGLQYKLFDIFQAYCSASSFIFDALDIVPWWDMPLIDEDWIRQALINTCFDQVKVLDYVDSARIYELTENGVSRENLLLFEYCTTLVSVFFTIVTAQELQILPDDADILHQDFMDIRSSALFAGGIAGELAFVEKMSESINHTHEGLSLHGTSVKYIIDVVSPFIVDAINEKIRNPKIKKVIVLSNDRFGLNCNISVGEYKEKKEANEICTDLPPLIREPRFDQPLIFVSGHTRTYRNGKTVNVKGFKRHKRMPADWYQHAA